MKLHLCFDCRHHSEAQAASARLPYKDGECELCASHSDMLLLCNVQPPPAFESAQHAIDTWFRNAFPED